MIKKYDTKQFKQFLSQNLNQSYFLSLEKIEELFIEYNFKKKK